MGCDLAIIIPSGFKDVRNKKKAELFLRSTVAGLKKTLMIEDIFFTMNDKYGDGTTPTDDWPNYLPQIDIFPYYGATLELGDGFWYLFNGFKHHQFFYPSGTQFIRHQIFDIVRALGKHEAWYCDEYEMEVIENWTLESWLEHAKKTDEGITEYNLNEIIKEGEAIWDSYKPIYHDSFEDVFPIFESIENKVKPRRLLGLSASEDGSVRVEENGHVMRIPVE